MLGYRNDGLARLSIPQGIAGQLLQAAVVRGRRLKENVFAAGQPAIQEQPRPALQLFRKLPPCEEWLRKVARQLASLFPGGAHPDESLLQLLGFRFDLAGPLQHHLTLRGQVLQQVGPV